MYTSSIVYWWSHSINVYKQYCLLSVTQGFMQDKMIANHTYCILVDKWMLTVKPVYKLLDVSDDL